MHGMRACNVGDIAAWHAWCGGYGDVDGWMDGGEHGDGWIGIRMGMNRRA